MIDGGFNQQEVVFVEMVDTACDAVISVPLVEKQQLVRVVEMRRNDIVRLRLFEAKVGKPHAVFYCQNVP